MKKGRYRRYGLHKVKLGNKNPFFYPSDIYELLFTPQRLSLIYFNYVDVHVFRTDRIFCGWKVNKSPG